MSSFIQSLRNTINIKGVIIRNASGEKSNLMLMKQKKEERSNKASKSTRPVHWEPLSLIYAHIELRSKGTSEGMSITRESLVTVSLLVSLLCLVLFVLPEAKKVSHGISLNCDKFYLKAWCSHNDGERSAPHSQIHSKLHKHSTIHTDPFPWQDVL